MPRRSTLSVLTHGFGGGCVRVLRIMIRAGPGRAPVSLLPLPLLPPPPLGEKSQCAVKVERTGPLPGWAGGGTARLRDPGRRRCGRNDHRVDPLPGCDDDSDAQRLRTDRTVVVAATGAAWKRDSELVTVMARAAGHNLVTSTLIQIAGSANKIRIL
jgi:hypothetical protein